MPEKFKLTVKNIERYLAILILIGGFVYLSQHIKEPQISTQTGAVFMLMELSCLEIWSMLKEQSQKHKTKENE